MTKQQNRITFGEPYEAISLPEEAMPKHSWPGEEGAEVPLESPFQVFFTQEVLEKMWQHAYRNPQLECAGGLFGHPFIQPETIKPPGKKIAFVIVAKAVHYETPEQSQGHVRVTANALEKANTHIARNHAGLRPVGWYHTHPGHGIFLSGYDRTIARSIFNAEWHVAIVLDPSRHQIGLFRGPAGERLSGYRVLREYPIPLELLLMQRYNQGCDLMDAGRLRAAQHRFRQIQKHRYELPFWRDKLSYRDTDERLRQLKEALPDLTRPALPPPSNHFQKKKQETTEVRKPRPVKDRFLDRTLETLEDIAYFPFRMAKGTQAAMYRLIKRTE